LEHRLLVQKAINLDMSTDYSGPTGLMASPKTCAIVAMKIFVKTECCRASADRSGTSPCRHIRAACFIIGKPEQTFLKDWILAVPECQGKAEDLLIIRETSQAIFPPMICVETRLIVAEIIPRIARIAVVFANGTPLSL
jgi:hypothetical protein